MHHIIHQINICASWSKTPSLCCRLLSTNADHINKFNYWTRQHYLLMCYNGILKTYNNIIKEVYENTKGVYENS